MSDENNSLRANRFFEPGFPLPVSISTPTSHPPTLATLHRQRLPLQPLSIVTNSQPPMQHPHALSVPSVHLNPIPTSPIPESLLAAPEPYQSLPREQDGSPSLLDEDDTANEVCPNGMVLYRRLSKLLDCPVCLEMMRPGNKAVGFCKFNHIFCQTCANELCKKELPVCPVCRSPGIDIVSHNYLAINLIDALADMTVYVCKYPSCNKSMIGTILQEHEKHCTERPLLCPRGHCQQSVPYYALVQQTHPCLNLSYARWSNNTAVGHSENVWEFTVDLDDVFCMDTCTEQVSQAYNPTLLLPDLSQHPLPTLPPNMSLAEKRMHEDREHATHNKLCFNAINSNGIIFYLEYIDGRIQSPTHDMEHSTFTISANCYTPYGKIGVYSRVQPVLHNGYIHRHTNGLALTRSDIHRFAVMSLPPNSRTSAMANQFCQICHHSPVPHMHIQIRQLKFD